MTEDDTPTEEIPGAARPPDPERPEHGFSLASGGPYRCRCGASFDDWREARQHLPQVITEEPVRLPIQMSVHRRSSRVVLNFSNPCSEFSMTSVVARQLADNLNRLAVEIEFRNR